MNQLYFGSLSAARERSVLTFRNLMGDSSSVPAWPLTPSSASFTGKIMPNQKFPDMKALGDYIHSLGLKC